MARKTAKKDGPPPDRADDVTIAQRITCIVQLMLDGAQSWDILQYVAERENAGEIPWKMGADQKHLCERQLRNYIAQARERISEAALQQEKDAIHLHISQRKTLYARCIEAGDYRTALFILEDLAKLTDLYPAPKKQTIGLEGGSTPIEMKHSGSISNEPTITAKDAAFAEALAASAAGGAEAAVGAALADPGASADRAEDEGIPADGGA